MKYKSLDKVRIKSLDWYNENKDEYGNIDINDDFTFYADRSKYCGRVFTIDVVFNDCYTVKEDNHEYYWTDEMIEGLVEEETSIKGASIWPIHWHNVDLSEEIKCPEGYQFKDENGNVINATKIVLEKKKKEYPKTYEKCCKVLSLGEDGRLYTKGYKASLIQNFQKLLIARDAYWKIAGEEMGLGKPWEPDWCSQTTKYTLRNNANKIIKEKRTHDSYVLAFPTAEMRDVFYENFKELIEQCKELL